MTVVVAVKVYDGIVLAADSATSLGVNPPTELVPGGQKITTAAQVYNNADKVFHLHRDLPIGLATWGGGHISSASIATLAKDLRRRLMGREPENADWELNKDEYTISEVAEYVVKLLFDELYSKSPSPSDYIGFFLAGYSSGARHPEGWEIEFQNSTVRPVPVRVWDTMGSGWRSYGQGDAVGRLLNGFGPSLKEALEALVPQEMRPALTDTLNKESRLAALDAMPFADAIDFAKFCVDTTIGYTRFLPGSEIVGGPVDVAGISRHEGFKWVQRKHYYPPELNPRRPHDHDQ